MTKVGPIASEPDIVTVHVPLTFAKRGGRKQVILPDGSSSSAQPRLRVDNAMVKAIARGFRWRTLLESGVHTTVDDIATAEKINPSYVSRVLRLTLLAPAIVETILDGRQEPHVTLDALMKPFPVEWEKQRLLSMSAR